MDSYYRVGNWDMVEEWARRLIKTKNFLFKTKKDLELIVATAMTRKAKDLETEGKTTASLEQLSKLRKEFRNNKEIMEYTTYTMAYLYAKQKRLKKAIENYESLIRNFPKSPKAAEALFVLAGIYERNGNQDKALQYMKKCLERSLSLNLDTDRIEAALKRLTGQSGE